MPMMDGLEATKIIKKIYLKNKKQISIIGVTGHTEETFKMKALA